MPRDWIEMIPSRLILFDLEQNLQKKDVPRYHFEMKFFIWIHFPLNKFSIWTSFPKKTLIQGNEEGLDDYVETALDQHALLEWTTVSLCMIHNPGGDERITIGWITYHTALMLVHMFSHLELGRWLTPAVIRDDQVCRRWSRETEVFYYRTDNVIEPKLT